MKGNPIIPIRHWLAVFRGEKGGQALIEFAIGLPVFLTIGLMGLDLSNLALTHLRLSQIALSLADNASRAGATSGLSQQQVREVDMNDILQGAKYQGAKINLTTNGRIIVSSLENTTGSQKIHWQRCLGLKSGSGYDSSYGTTSATAGTDTTAGNSGTAAASGMGDPGSQVNAPSGSGVMFVEINYRYTPMFSWLSSPSRIHYVASFIVRDPRDFSQIYPGATRSTCDLYTS